MAKASTEAVARNCLQAFAMMSKPNSLTGAAIIHRVSRGSEHESSLGSGADAAAADLAGMGIGDERQIVEPLPRCDVWAAAGSVDT